MREIKFRAWSKNNKEMWQAANVIFSGGKVKLNYCYSANGDDRIPMGEDPDDFKVMQYTGLKDKNGIEIYEGDIVGGDFRRNIPGEKNLTKAVIKFYQGCFWLQWIEDSGKMPMHNFDTGILVPNTIHEVGIIGNIYENPELLNH